MAAYQRLFEHQNLQVTAKWILGEMSALYIYIRKIMMLIISFNLEFRREKPQSWKVEERMI